MSATVRSIRDGEAIKEALEYLREGEVIILPTETVYGVAIMPTDGERIEKLYRIREREPEPAWPFLLANQKPLKELARVSRPAQQLARRFWPGALTIILPPGPILESPLNAQPVALRVPNFPPLLPLLEGAGGYLMVTGALRSGYPAAISADEALHYFGDSVAMILDGGKAPYGVPSSIVDCVASPPEIVRRGAIPDDKIWAALGIKPRSQRPR